MLTGDGVNVVDGGKEKDVDEGEEVVEALDVVEGAEDWDVDGFEDTAVTDGGSRGYDGLGVQNPERGEKKAKKGQSKQRALEFALAAAVALGWVERLGSSERCHGQWEEVELDGANRGVAHELRQELGEPGQQVMNKQAGTQPMDVLCPGEEARSVDNRGGAHFPNLLVLGQHLLHLALGWTAACGTPGVS